MPKKKPAPRKPINLALQAAVRMAPSRGA